MIGIDAVAEDSGMVCLSLFQEVKLQCYCALVPVGLSCHIPVTVLLAGCDDIFAHLSLRDDGAVEHCGEGCNHIHALLLLLIIGGSVAEHSKRRVMHYVACQLMAACSHAHRCCIDSLPVVLCAVAHSTRSEIHSSCHHADVWEGHVV